MPLKGNEAIRVATVIRRILINRHAQAGDAMPFAFATRSSSTADPILWSARQRVDGEPRSAIVDVLQAIHAGRNAALGEMTLYGVANMPITDMCRGMFQFVTQYTAGTYNDKLKAEAIDSFIRNNTDTQHNWARLFPGLAEATGRLGNEPVLQRINEPDIKGTPALNLRVDVPSSANPQVHGNRTVHRVYMMLAFAIAYSRLRPADNDAMEEDQTKEGHNIGAVLVDEHGKILSWGTNTIHTPPGNYTHHAEVNTIQNLYLNANSRIPRHARLYVTLRPCKMCAGMIKACAEDPATLKIYYAENDRNADGSVLHQMNPPISFLLAGAAEGQQRNLPRADVKPVRSYQSRNYDAQNKGINTQDLSVKIHRERARLLAEKDVRAITQFLDTADAQQLFKSSVDALFRKYDKYQQVKGNDNVRMTLKHIQPLLTNLGYHAVPFIADPLLFCDEKLPDHL